jgi:DNA polymerase-3 subunit gamma/tau
MGGAAEQAAQAPAPTSAPASQTSTPAPAATQAPKQANPAADKIAAVSAPAGVGGITLLQFRDAWPNILTIVNKKSKAAWMVAFALNVIDFTGDVLTLKFLSQKDLDSFKNSDGASEVLRGAIMDVLGVQVKFKAQIDAKPEVKTEAPATTPIAVIKEQVVEAVPIEEPAQETAEEPAEEEFTEPAADKKSRNSGMADESARYGESLLREMLGAEPMQDKNGK